MMKLQAKQNVFMGRTHKPMPVAKKPIKWRPRPDLARDFSIMRDYGNHKFLLNYLLRIQRWRKRNKIARKARRINRLKEA